MTDLIQFLAVYGVVSLVGTAALALLFRGAAATEDRDG
jgi:hypothetical protein